MQNLVEMIGKQLTPELVNSLSSMTGGTTAETQNALKSVVPALVGGLAKQGSSAGGAQQMLDLLGKQTGGADLLGNLAGVLGDPAASQKMLSTGGDLVNGIFGKNTDGIVNAIASAAGIKGEAASSLLKMVAPIGAGVLAKVIKDGGLNASGLSNLLGGQADFVKAAAPKGLTDALGISTTPVPPAPPKAPTPLPAPQKRSLNWLWLVIGALALLALLWFLFLRPKPQTVDVLPASVQAPICAALGDLEKTVAGLPAVTADTTVDELKAGQGQVKAAFDNVVNALGQVRPDETKALQAAFKTYDDAVTGITGSSTVGDAFSGVTTARKGVADAQAKLLAGLNCK